MAPIRLLDESIAQKIAAGEVVERPASVVKELVENAIDAGSTFITVEIVEGGIQRIRVTDNGCGIPADEVPLAFERHATSKIATMDDLYAISHMGFRGEALYSIAAVSRLELTTKPPEQANGLRYAIHGGKPAGSSAFGCPDGTTIIIADLFYNTPARLKFLAKPAVEAGYVGSAISRLILSNPGVSIKFISSGKVLYHSAGDASLKNAVYTVHGRDIAAGLIPVRQHIGSLGVEGFLFPPSAARGNRGAQLLVVNGRAVTHGPVSGIVERLVGGLVDSRRFPGYVFALALPFGDVDVNVHPNKLQVRFANEHQIRQLIEVAVSKALEQHLRRPLQWSFDQSAAANDSVADATGHLERAPDSEPANPSPLTAIAPVVTSSLSAGDTHNPISPSYEKKEQSAEPTSAYVPDPVLPDDEIVAIKPIIKPAAVSPAAATLAPKAAPKETLDEAVSRYAAQVNLLTGHLPALDQPLPLQQKPSIPAVPVPSPEQQKIIAGPSLRVIGQTFDTYLLAQLDDKLLMIDQHAAHERLWYERYRAAIGGSQPCSQRLLIAQVVQLSHEMKAVLEENLDTLTRLGFEIEEYGRLTYRVNAVPFLLGQPQVQDFLLQVLDALYDDRSARTLELKEEKIMSMACKRAVKGGDRLDPAELQALVSILSREDVPLTCPHGRPFVLIMSRHDMERQFRRVK